MLQRTRCSYFRDLASRCNKRAARLGLRRPGRREPDARDPRHERRLHRHPRLRPGRRPGRAGRRGPRPRQRRASGRSGSLDFHALPGETPQVENALKHGEMILSIDLPASPLAARSHYLKVRDRASYEFALVSVAAVPAGGGRQGRGVARRPGRRRHQALALARGRGRPARPAGERRELRPGRRGRPGRRQDPRAQRVQARTGPEGDRPRPEHPGRTVMNPQGQRNPRQAG